MLLFFLTFTTGLYISVVAMDISCTWPPYFDVSKKGWPIKDEERSWETETKVETDTDPKINWFPKSRKLISIWDNHTLDIIKFDNKRRESSDRYSCSKSFGNDLFLLKKEDKSGGAVAYRCMQLHPESKFVIRWRIGPEITTTVCSDEFASIEESPLIYFPVRETALNSNLNKYFDFFNESKPCPPSGGYIIDKIMKSNGEQIDTKCQESGLIARMEVDCASGEGIYIREAGGCEGLSMVQGVGSKLFCLAHWDEGIYTFRVLVPAGATNINSFHCLRLNKDNPTSSNAILFLDSFCSTASPNKNTMSFFKIQLRHHGISGMCDDFMDSCTGGKCDQDNIRRECFSTCDSCPVNGTESLKTDNSLRGTWLLQKRGFTSEVTITENTFEFGGLKNFKAYAKPDDELCIAPPDTLKKDSYALVLAHDGEANGCVPRVTQLRMRLVADSVAVLHLTASSPLRNDEFISTPSKWCRNNFIETESFASIFRPFWPYSRNEKSEDDTGFQIVVKKSQQTPACCKLGHDLLQHAAHMSVKVEFQASGKHYSCGGETHSVDDDKWRLEYKSCNHQNASGNLLFQCLANFEVNEDYQALTLKAPTISDSGEPQSLILTDQFYCLLIPKDGHTNLPIIIHQAGECDSALAEWVIKNERKPLVKLNFLQTLTGPTSKDSGSCGGTGVGNRLVISFLGLILSCFSGALVNMLSSGVFNVH